MNTFALLAACCAFACILTARADERDDLGADGFADSGGVKIHYVTKGTGPLVVLGFAQSREIFVGQGLVVDRGALQGLDQGV